MSLDGIVASPNGEYDWIVVDRLCLTNRKTLPSGIEPLSCAIQQSVTESKQS